MSVFRGLVDKIARFFRPEKQRPVSPPPKSTWIPTPQTAELHHERRLTHGRNPSFTRAGPGRYHAGRDSPPGAKLGRMRAW